MHSLAIHPTKRLDGSRFTRRAWWSVLGFVPSFALAFAIGEGLISALGYPVGGDTPPWWAVLVATTPALVVFVLPAAASVHFGRQALQRGDSRAQVPMTVALVVAAGFVVINVVSALAT